MIVSAFDVEVNGRNARPAAEDSGRAFAAHKVLKDEREEGRQRRRRVRARRKAGARGSS
jgi:hypothetical protein